MNLNTAAQERKLPLLHDATATLLDDTLDCEFSFIKPKNNNKLEFFVRNHPIQPIGNFKNNNFNAQLIYGRTPADLIDAGEFQQP